MKTTNRVENDDQNNKKATFDEIKRAFFNAERDYFDELQAAFTTAQQMKDFDFALQNISDSQSGAALYDDIVKSCQMKNPERMRYDLWVKYKAYVRQALRFTHSILGNSYCQYDTSRYMIAQPIYTFSNGAYSRSYPPTFDPADFLDWSRIYRAVRPNYYRGYPYTDPTSGAVDTTWTTDHQRKLISPAGYNKSQSRHKSETPQCIAPSGYHNRQSTASTAATESKTTSRTSYSTDYFKRYREIEELSIFQEVKRLLDTFERKQIKLDEQIKTILENSQERQYRFDEQLEQFNQLLYTFKEEQELREQHLRALISERR